MKKKTLTPLPVNKNHQIFQTFTTWSYKRIHIYEGKLKMLVNVVKPLDRVPILLNLRKSMLERNLTNVVYVSKLLPDLQALLSIIKYIMNRKHQKPNLCGNTFIKSSGFGDHQRIQVERHLKHMIEIKLMQVFILLNVRDSNMERNHVKLMYVAKPITRAHTSLDIRIYIFERKHTNVWQSLSRV